MRLGILISGNFLTDGWMYACPGDENIFRKYATRLGDVFGPIPSNLVLYKDLSPWAYSGTSGRTWPATINPNAKQITFPRLYGHYFKGYRADEHYTGCGGTLDYTVQYDPCYKRCFDSHGDRIQYDLAYSSRLYWNSLLSTRCEDPDRDNPDHWVVNVGTIDITVDLFGATPWPSDIIAWLKATENNDKWQVIIDINSAAPLAVFYDKDTYNNKIQYLVTLGYRTRTYIFNPTSNGYYIYSSTTVTHSINGYDGPPPDEHQYCFPYPCCYNIGCDEGDDCTWSSTWEETLTANMYEY